MDFILNFVFQFCLNLKWAAIVGIFFKLGDVYHYQHTILCSNIVSSVYVKHILKNRHAYPIIEN